MTKSTSKKESFSASGILVNNQGQIVLVLMDNEAWSFPKGHIDKNESVLDAAKREVEEETGVRSFELLEELGTYQRPCADDQNEIKNITLFLFKTSEVGLSPFAKDVTKAIWVDKTKATSILSSQEDRDFFESISEKLRDALA